MAKVTLQTIKNWFKTGLKPTEAQFSDTFDSLVHKDDLIPVAQVEGIQDFFDGVNNNVNFANILNLVYKMKLDFSWTKKPGGFIENVNGIDRVTLLQIAFVQFGILFNKFDEVWLEIDRYKPKKKLKVGKFKSSGFKHSVYPDINNPNRPSEILLTNTHSILDFGQAFYFKPLNNKSIIQAKGMARRNSCQNRSWVYLQFRLRLVKGDKVYNSNVKGTIEMNLRQSPQGYVISYKLV